MTKNMRPDNTDRIKQAADIHHTLANTALSPKLIKQLKEVLGQIKPKQKTPSFSQCLPNIDVTILFNGPSGTGKIMSAEVLANELRLNLYRIDLSILVSKYIGETEKNLTKIFNKAETSNAILFFDEADALFGKRSEVKDSHERYANIETSYLLQRLEAFSGIVILSTNQSKDLDPVFIRRLQYILDFSSPGNPLKKNARKRILKKPTKPNQTP